MRTDGTDGFIKLVEIQQQMFFLWIKIAIGYTTHGFTARLLSIFSFVVIIELVFNVYTFDRYCYGCNNSNITKHYSHSIVTQ